MITMSVQINGLNKIKENLRRYPDISAPIYDQAAQTSAHTLRDFTKAQPDIPVDTGRMRQSIADRRIRLMAAGVYVGVHYGVYVHEGTKRMTKRPFFQWALDGGAMKAINKIYDSATLSILKKL